MTSMDEIVKQAIAKWPDVPHCFGWLGLDARGAWRMRDEQAQALNTTGDKIVHAALSSFIIRNYTHDAEGRWYFQNGPQRVYVNLETTPYIAHTDPAQGFVLHTGEPLTIVDGAWITEFGELLLEGAAKVAQVNDRDMAECLAQLRLDGQPMSDERLLAWLSEPASTQHLSLNLASRRVPVQRIAHSAIAQHFGFVRMPQPDAD
jgi:hypothetical protein